MTKNKRRKTAPESNSTYFLKLVFYMILGSQWIFVVDEMQTRQLPLPLGLLLGLLFTSHEHFQIDRKIEFAVLLIATLIGFWTHTGVLVQLL